MSVDILGTSWDQCRSMVQYSFTSTETRRLVRTDSPGQLPRLSHSSWTMCYNNNNNSRHFIARYLSDEGKHMQTYPEGIFADNEQEWCWCVLYSHLMRSSLRNRSLPDGRTQRRRNIWSMALSAASAGSSLKRWWALHTPKATAVWKKQA